MSRDVRPARRGRWQAQRRLSLEFIPLLVRALLIDLLRARPVEDGGEYLRAYLRAIVSTLRRRQVVTPNEELSREVVVRYRGRNYLVTPQTVFGYYLLPFEPATARRLARASGGIFVDVGANVGQYTIALAHRFQKVVAVEPNPIARGILHRNLELNGITNVQVEPVGVAGEAGAARLYRGDFLSTWSLTPSENESVPVTNVTLDQLLLPYDRVDLLKMDIEGSEVAVLLRSSVSLSRVHELDFETDLDRDVSVLFRALRSEGFELEVLGGWWRDRENIHATRVVNAGGTTPTTA